MITAELAWNLRARGLQLPTTTERQYATQRLGEIADRQAVLMQEHSDLDCELLRLAAEEENGRQPVSGTHRVGSGSDDPA